MDEIDATKPEDGKPAIKRDLRDALVIINQNFSGCGDELVGIRDELAEMRERLGKLTAAVRTSYAEFEE